MLDSNDPQVTGRRLSALLATYLGLVVGVITLAPFRFALPEHFTVHWLFVDEGWSSDVLLNIVLFVPLGFVLRRASPAFRDRHALRVLVLCTVASATIETLQLFIVPRFSTVSDVLSNAFGAWIGARLSDLLTAGARDGRALVGRLRLDLPLMGVVYLLLPLLWLDGLIARGDHALWPMLPLGVSGALALSAVSQQTALACAVSAFAWFAIGAVPMLRTAPGAAAVAALIVPTAAWLGCHLWRRALRRDRRLEPQVVRLLVPAVALHLYLAGTAAATLTLDGGQDNARVHILAWIGRMSAFTLLGYLLAESRGRRVERWRSMVLVPAIGTMVVGALLALVGGDNLSPISLLIPIAGAVLGSTLYHFQRAHILAVLGIQKAMPTPASS